MREFKVGDRVKIKDFTTHLNGKEGIIDFIYPKTGRFDCIVIVNGQPIAFFERELEMVHVKEKVVFT